MLTARYDQLGLERGDKILDLGFRPCVQPVISGTHVGKFRVGAPGWEDTTGQERVFRRDRSE